MFLIRFKILSKSTAELGAWTLSWYAGRILLFLGKQINLNSHAIGFVEQTHPCIRVCIYIYIHLITVDGIDTVFYPSKWVNWIEFRFAYGFIVFSTDYSVVHHPSPLPLNTVRLVEREPVTDNTYHLFSNFVFTVNRVWSTVETYKISRIKNHYNRRHR